MGKVSVVNKVETHLARGTLLALIFCAACSTPKPIVVSNEVFPKDLASVNRELTSAESERVINVMASTRQQKDIDGARPFEKCPQGRWSEVYQAAILGARAIEMAVISKVDEVDGLRIAVITLNNDSGELVVKGDAVKGVQSAKAKIGLFGERVKEADALVDAFYSQLWMLGSIPRPTESAPITTATKQ